MATMDTRDETAAAKLIEVLSRIDITLETLDRRLQALEHASQTAPPGFSSTSAPDADRIEVAKYLGFSTKHKVGPYESNEVHEITVESREFLSVLSEVSSPCLNRHRDAQTEHAEPKTFTRPFTELLCYRDALKFAIDQRAQPDNELRNLFSQQLLNCQQRSVTIAVLNGLEDQCKSLIERRDADLSRGVVLYDDLPTLYSPGSLLLAPGEAGHERVVEVSSCDMLASSATSGVCVVQVWYFKWDGKAFSRESDRFDMARYTGTRPIHGLPYRPLVGTHPATPSKELQRLHSRNQENMRRFGAILDADTGDHPVCLWAATSSTVRPTHPTKPCPVFTRHGQLTDRTAP
jgi:hypothetical protein